MYKRKRFISEFPEKEWSDFSEKVYIQRSRMSVTVKTCHWRMEWIWSAPSQLTMRTCLQSCVTSMGAQF